MGFLSIQSITPPGVILPFAGSVAPNGWLLCQGQAVSRATYAALFASICISFTSVTRNGTTTLTIGGAQNPITLGVASGMPISGTGIPAGATVSSVTSNTIVISSAASGSGTSTAAVCPYGVGDTVNTFNLPDTRGIFLRGIGTNPSNVNNTTTIGTRQLDDFKSHAHSLVSTQNTGFGYAAGGNSPVWEKGGASGAQTIGSTGGTETRPANVGVNHIIKV